MPDRFDELVASLAKEGRRLNQHLPEWRTFLECTGNYLKDRGVNRPIVVEIGILEGAQKRFYEDLLGAYHIGIDNNPHTPADIIGNSAAPQALAKLKTILGGRMIDLLFIDGLHTFEGVKADYEIYGPLTRHIVAIHDILTPKVKPTDAVDVIRFWTSLVESNKADTILTIQHYKQLRVEFNGLPMGIGMILKSPVPAPKSMRISVISRWFNEEFFAPYFLSHYSWADEIIVLLEKSTSDRSAEIIGQFQNARIEWVDFKGELNDRLFADMMSDLAAKSQADWIIRADADELIFAPGNADPGTALAQADGNVVEVLFHWIYRHRNDADLDPLKSVLYQRRHGGAYTMWPGMGPTFTKPSIARPSSGIRWRPGEQGYENSPNVKMSRTRFEGSHWQMVDVNEAVRRLLGAEKRLSAANKANNWGVRRFTEEQIWADCKAHENDPEVI
jgi:hypothetical protein